MKTKMVLSKENSKSLSQNKGESDIMPEGDKNEG